MKNMDSLTRLRLKIVGGYVSLKCPQEVGR